MELRAAAACGVRELAFVLVPGHIGCSSIRTNSPCVANLEATAAMPGPMQAIQTCQHQDLRATISPARKAFAKRLRRLSWQQLYGGAALIGNDTYDPGTGDWQNRSPIRGLDETGEVHRSRATQESPDPSAHEC